MNEKWYNPRQCCCVGMFLWPECETTSWGMPPYYLLKEFFSIIAVWLQFESWLFFMSWLLWHNHFPSLSYFSYNSLFFCCFSCWWYLVASSNCRLRWHLYLPRPCRSAACPSLPQTWSFRKAVWGMGRQVSFPDESWDGLLWFLHLQVNKKGIFQVASYLCPLKEVTRWELL